MDEIYVSNLPFVRSKNDINRMFLYMCVALMIPAVYGFLFFGVKVVAIVLTSVVTCFLSEVFYNLIKFKKIKVEDLSFLVTGLILALTMPEKVPLYIVVASAFFSIFVVKLVFGGLGLNKFNPANTGRCFAGVVSSGFLGEFFNIIINGEEFTSLASGGTNTLQNLIAGQAVGGIGTTCILVIVICFVFLTYTGVVDFKIPIISAIAYFVTANLLVGFEPAVQNLLSGSFLFVAVFMMTDPNTSPDGFFTKIVYSVLFGSLSALVWNLGLLGENTVFVVALFVNVLAPIMDKYFIIRPISLGGYRNAYKN